jgi:hypothetical protein
MGWAQAIFAGVGAANEISADVKATQKAIAEAQDNKKLALEAAADAIDRGNRESGRTRMEGSRLVAAQNVAYANSGVDASVGTPVRVMADTAALSELDAKTQENNAAREAWGFKRYGLKYQAQAGLEAARGSNKITATALTGAGRAAGGLYSEWERGGWGGEDKGGKK